MTKKKLRRLLRSTRRQLDLSEELVAELRLQRELDVAADPARFGVCLPVPSWRDREELGIRTDADRELDDLTTQLQAERAKRREAERKLAGRGFGFTVVRDVNEQTERALGIAQADLREARCNERGLRAEVERLTALFYEHGLDPTDDPDRYDDGERAELPDEPEPQPELPPHWERRVGPGDVLYITDREGGSLVRVEVESLRLHGVHGEPIEVVINPRPGRAP